MYKNPNIHYHYCNTQRPDHSYSNEPNDHYTLGSDDIFKPLRRETVVLPKGSVHGEDALPLPCEILLDRDVPVMMRDGTVIYADVLRPVTEKRVPAIVCWSPYGKEFHRLPLPWYAPGFKLSNLQKFESLDPALWCANGYAIVHPDARGSLNSEGVLRVFDASEGEDGSDFVDWVGEQEWCNGKVGTAGNSWLAVSQWFIAAEQPKHLTAIAPWESLTDMYRDLCARGGIPDGQFTEMMIAEDRKGLTRIDAVHEMLNEYPLFNEYWQTKCPDFSKVEVPAYVVGSYTNLLHVAGTSRAFRAIPSKEKWLRIHNSHEWSDIIANAPDLMRFFDHYLKGEDNGWEKTPRVRLAVLDPGGEDTVDRAEHEWPLKRTDYRRLYLDAASMTLEKNQPSVEAKAEYVSDDLKDRAEFLYTFEEDTELVGYMKAHLWVETTETDDMDIFLCAQKLDKNGQEVCPLIFGAPYSGFEGAPHYGPNGRLRVSLRRLDPDKSTDFEPVPAYTTPEKIAPYTPTEIELPFWPMGMRFHKGETLRLAVTGFSIQPQEFMQHGPVPTLNKGVNIICTGGQHDSYLSVPYV